MQERGRKDDMQMEVPQVDKSSYIEESLETIQFKI